MFNKEIRIEPLLIGSRTTEFTLVDYPTMDDWLSSLLLLNVLKSSDRLKQEILWNGC